MSFTTLQTLLKLRHISSTKSRKILTRIRLRAGVGLRARKRQGRLTLDKYNSKIAKLIGKINGCDHYAVTISSTCTLYSEPKDYVMDNLTWVRHEGIHKAQYIRYGWFGFIIRYLWYSLRFGYTRNPLEREARGEL